MDDGSANQETGILAVPNTGANEKNDRGATSVWLLTGSVIAAIVGILLFIINKSKTKTVVK